MNVCFFNSSKTWGGGEKWHFDMASMLHEKGYSVMLMTGLHSELFDRARNAGLPCRRIKVTNLSFLNCIRIIRLSRYFRKHAFDAIIINLSADLKLAGISAKLAGVRNIIYRRGSAIPIRNKPFNRFLFSRIINRIIANSEETKRTILQNNSRLFPLEKITTLYNGINLNAFDNMPAGQLFARKEHEFIIGNAGRLVHQKGQQHLIRLASILDKEGLDFRIVIAGSGPMEEQLRQKAADARVEHRITFLGFVDQMKAFMESIDIFVLTSLWEGFGYVLAEAMACRKPVVAFRISSNPEIVTDNETGYLVELRDMEAMADKVLKLAADGSLREKMGIKGRERVEKMFNITRNKEAFEQFLQALHG